MRLKTKLGLLLAVVVGAMSLCLALLGVRLADTVRDYQGLFANDVEQQGQVRQLQLTFKKQVQEWKDVLVRGKDPALLVKHSEAFHAKDAEVQRTAEDLAAKVSDPAAHAALVEFATAHAAMSRAYGAALADFGASADHDPRTADARVKGIDRPPTDLLDQAVASIGKATHARMRALDAASERTMSVVLASALALVLATTVGGVFFVRSLTIPIQSMAAAAARIADGDIDQVVAYVSRDELGDLAASLRGSIAYIRGVAAKVDALARGELTEPTGAADPLTVSVERSSTALRDVVGRMGELIEATRNGRLDVRARRDGVLGVYGELLDGMHGVMTAFAEPMAEARRVLELLANRDLSARATGSYHGEYGHMMESINRAIANLGDTLSDISASADHVATAAREISTGNQSLSQAATEQASSLEEVTSSLQEITAMSKQNAASSQEARAMAEAARDGASRGVQSMDQLSAAVRSIKEHADQTAKIVKTIDEIAFQTNLLSLNAAVEAARAGDAGKGFAVVAEEVRNLAMRSAEAAKSTASLIEESVKSSETGVRLNEEVAAHFGAINGKVRQVVEVMGEIAAASEHQSRGVAQINGAVDEMSRVTQHNAATTEQSAAAAEELSAQSASVMQRVRTFTLRKGGGRGMATVTSFPPPRTKSRPASATARARAGAQAAATGTSGDADAFLPLDDGDASSDV
jgi:methyl-accepting chemotaxis protein